MRQGLIAAVVALAVVCLGPERALAQDASPMASPSTTACVAPPSVAGTPAALASSPTAGEVGPVTEPPATPDAATGPVGTPADQATVDRVVAAERNLQNCINAGEYDIVIALHAPEAVPLLFGTGDPVEAAAMLEGFPQVENVALENVQLLPDGRISVEVTFTAGGELMRWRDYWVDRNGFLVYAGYDELPLEEATPTP